MRSTIAYTTARILLFVASTVLLYLAGFRGLLLLGLALLISGIASYVLLSRQRDAMSGALTARLAGARGALNDFRGRLDAGTRAEDGAELEPAGPEGAAPAPAGPGTTGLEPAGPGTAGPQTAGPGTAGPGTAGPDAVPAVTRPAERPTA